MAWLLIFYLAGTAHFIPGIADEAACHQLAQDIGQQMSGIPFIGSVNTVHCIAYKSK